MYLSQLDVGIHGRSCEGREDTEQDEKVVSELRSELWEKERKLTDIRLEALSSAHQLEQLQEAMTNMQVCVRRCLDEHQFMSRPVKLISSLCIQCVHLLIGRLHEGYVK